VATYTVKAPDGKMVTLQGPDGASQSDILAQAQALYKPQAAPPKSAPRPVAAPNEFLDRYNSIRNGLGAKFTDPAQKAAALSRFDSDPRAQQLRKSAGLAPLSTANGDVKAVARQSVAQRVRDAGADIGKGATGFQSAAAGISRGMFGIPEIVAAAGERFLPSALTGNRTNASFGNILQMIRAKDTAAIDANPTAGLAGELGGGLVGAGQAGKLVMGGARRLAATGAPVVARVARAVEGVGTLRKGQKLANTGKLIATGAAGGGAQAAGTGEDVPTGIAEGAVAAPVVAGGIKLGQVVTRPFRDFLQMSSAGQLLSRLTKATAQQLNERAAQYRAATGAEPTLFELLPQADRSKLLSQGVVNNHTAEQASKAIRARADNLGPEMADVTTKALQPGRDTIRANIVGDLTKARGGKLAPGDDELIDKAMRSPTDMEALRKIEAKAIMAPHKDTTVANNLVDLLPTMPGPNGSKIDLDPEVSHAIRSSAGSIRLRAPGEPITADEVTNMMTTLGAEARKGGFEGQTAQTAIDHLQSVLHANTPEAGAAAQQMTESYAARSRMLEGMKFGQSGQLRDSVQIGTSGRQARTVRNAFDSPEGQAGLELGQGNALDTNLGGSPDEALRATIAQSRGSTSRELGQNVGPAAAEKITAAAQAQDQSAQALASAAKNANNPDEAGTGEGLMQAIVGLHPGSFATTKAWSVRRLMDMTYIPENRAKTIVDMVFSQDPTMRTRALRAIGNEPNGATFLKYLAGTGGQLTEEANAPDNSGPPAEPVVTQPASAAEIPADEPPAAPEAAPADDAQPSPYQAGLQSIYQNENPDLIDLVQRVKHQESRGNQGAVSPKGAIGIMQVMPDTAPEAARLAGVPWDPQAFHSDAAYNEILGIAYLSELLRKYGGDVSRALAAYNAGPGATDHAMASHGDAWLTAMPAETQDYVARVG
jgi:soluble lytic murein transglycosylase-like protein